MKNLKCLILILNLCVISVFADDLTVQISKEIDFSNGFGQIEAKPVLNNVKKDIKVLGEYNVDEKSRNVTMKIDKVIIDNQVFSLSESFNSKRRLKNTKTAKLKSGSKIKLSEGNNQEILAILNGETAANNIDNSQTNSGGGSNQLQRDTQNTNGTNYGSGASGSNGNNNSGYNPYYPNYNDTTIPGDTTKDYSSATTNTDGSCKAGEISGDFAYIYVLDSAGKCIKKATTINNVFTRTNTPTCPNKIDYTQNLVSVGSESYAIIEDTEYRVEQCKYGNMINLQNEVGSCSAIPDYNKRTAIIQKQFYYIHNNERINVGGCKPIEEIVTIYDDDFNECKYRYDFENFKAIKQTQWYYHLQNKKENLGECVDVDDERKKTMVYPLRESVEDCQCISVSNSVQNCQTKLVFNGFGNEKINATECRYVDLSGVNLIDEFAGYSFKDDSKQAIRKINQYYIGQDNSKIYVTKDKETNTAYPYIVKSCGWEHKEDLKLSYHKAKVVIEDRDEDPKNIEKFAKLDSGDVIVKDCQSYIDTVLYWQQQLGNVIGSSQDGVLKTHTRKTLMPENQSTTTDIYYIRELENGKAKLERADTSTNNLWSNQQIISSNNFKGSGSLKERIYSNSGKGIFGMGSMGGGANYANSYPTYNLTLTEDPKSFVFFPYKTFSSVGTQQKIANRKEFNFDIPLVFYPGEIEKKYNWFNGIYEEGTSQTDLIKLAEETKNIIGADGECIKYEGQKDDKNKPDYNPLAGECKTQIIEKFSYGITFEPVIDEFVSNLEKQYCQAEENIMLEKINLIAYELPDTNIVFTFNKTTNKNTYESEYIDKYEKEALNTKNYSITINKISCNKEDDTLNLNWNRILGDIFNQRGITDNLSVLEADSLDFNFNHNVVSGQYCYYKRLTKKCNWWSDLIQSWNYFTKENWGSNQTIYEYPMYRRFKRPDGSIFDLYERQGYFTEQQTSVRIYK